MTDEECIAAIRPLFDAHPLGVPFSAAAEALMPPPMRARREAERETDPTIGWEYDPDDPSQITYIPDPPLDAADIAEEQEWRRALIRLASLVSREWLRASGQPSRGVLGLDDRRLLPPPAFHDFFIDAPYGIGEPFLLVGGFRQARILIHPALPSPSAANADRAPWPMKSPAGRKKVHDWKPFHQEMLRFASIDGLTSKAQLQRHMKAWADQFEGGPGDKAIEDEVSDYWPPSLPEVRGS